MLTVGHDLLHFPGVELPLSQLDSLNSFILDSFADLYIYEKNADYLLRDTDMFRFSKLAATLLWELNNTSPVLPADLSTAT